MNEPPVVDSRRCPYCDAHNQSRAIRCWMCHEPLGPNPWAVSTPGQTNFNQLPSRESWSTVDYVFAWLLVLSVLLTVLIGIGFAVQDTGMLVPFMLLVGPAYLATGIRAVLPSRNSTSVKPTSLFVWFVVSFSFTCIIAFILVVASIVALFISCLNGMQH